MVSVLVYVDDLIVMGSSQASIHTLITMLASEFELKDLEHFHYFWGSKCFTLPIVFC